MAKKLKFILSILIVLYVLISVPILGTSLSKTDTKAYADGMPEYVYLGGIPIGIDAESEYFTVAKLVEVVTSDGAVSPAQKAGLLPGDVILSVNGEKLSNYNQISDRVKSDDFLTLLIKRGDNELSLKVFPVKDLVTGDMKLGLHLKKGISGVGTLTYIKPESYRYGGLGHPIFSVNEREKSLYNKGKIYASSIIGVEKGVEGKAGELKGAINRNKEIGTLDRNLYSGVFGYISEEVAKKQPKISVGKSVDVKPGAAFIYTTVFGDVPEKYEIEIIKAGSAEKEGAKNLVLRVTDKNLLQKTGGIVQGMSGSPIIQDGKLVGAVTHVFINDPTTGYGIFIDRMLDK